jgi:hypothetical protein
VERLEGWSLALRSSGLRLGLIMNFNAPVLWREIKRVVL